MVPESAMDMYVIYPDRIQWKSVAVSKSNVKEEEAHALSSIRLFVNRSRAEKYAKES